VHPYDDPEVIAGQGTIGIEILRHHPQRIHAIFVPVGGGGLIGGIGVITVTGLTSLSGGTQSGVGTLLAKGGVALTSTSFALDAGRVLEHALDTPEAASRDHGGLDAVGGLNVGGGSGDNHGVFRGAQRRGGDSRERHRSGDERKAG